VDGSFSGVPQPGVCRAAVAGQKKRRISRPPAPAIRRRALHALNRLTFGPRPGDVQQVMAIGVDQWIDLQLHPEKIDDSALVGAWSRCGLSA
jgi:hypothetical protein